MLHADYRSLSLSDEQTYFRPDAYQSQPNVVLHQLLPFILPSIVHTNVNTHTHTHTHRLNDKHQVYKADNTEITFCRPK